MKSPLLPARRKGDTIPKKGWLVSIAKAADTHSMFKLTIINIEFACFDAANA